MSYEITVEGGTSLKLLTGGKYCESDIIVTATGGGGASGDSDLPSGCRRVSYIKFESEQIVDTGIVCNQDTKIRILYNRESTGAEYLYGVASSGNTASVTAYLSNNGSWRFGNKYSARPHTVQADIIRNATVTKSGILHETGTATLSGVSDFETVGTLLIGSCRNADGTIGTAQYNGRVYLFEMWSGETQILKLIPVVDADGNYHFYDAIGKKLFNSITSVPLKGGNL